MNQIAELYGIPTHPNEPVDWLKIYDQQHCPYIAGKCTKIRKSTPDITIGSCTVTYSRERRPTIICPNRLLEQRQIFLDCLHLLTSHEPGNQLHIVPEISVPGGSVDYFLVSTKNNRVKDFVGIELQALDTTGSVWPSRQKFLHAVGVKAELEDTAFNKTFGMKLEDDG